VREFHQTRHAVIELKMGEGGGRNRERTVEIKCASVPAAVSADPGLDFPRGQIDLH
jgi:hypothetical protein